MSSFFTIPGAQKKRKRVETNENPQKRFATSSKPKSREPKAAKAPPSKPQRDESISGSDSESEDTPRDDEEFGADTSGSESEEETAAERRLRLAERYLDNVRSEVEINPEGFDAEEIDRDLIAERLKEDVAESKGRIYRKLAEELEFTKARHSNFRNDSETVTAVATYSPSTSTTSSSAPSTSPAYVYTASKSMVLAKWKLQGLPDQQFKSKKKKKNWKPPPPKRVPEQIASVRGDRRKSKDTSYQGHVDAILCIAASQDGRFVVTGGRDRRLIVWDSDLKPLRVFTQHRDAVCALAFRRGTNQLFSASKDRTIKVWSLNELAYVETLFGHQDEVVGLAALAQERCVSVGARDRTARLWKVVEETQLVFRGGGGSKKSKGAFMEGSMDCVAMIDEETFVTGSDSGSISLWSIHKKKPIFTLPLAHGIDKPLEPNEASAEKDPDLSIVPPPQSRWITALTTIPYSDIILSGSWDGNVRAWKLSSDKKKIEEIGAVASNPELKGEESTEAELQIRSMTAKGIINEISVFERGDRGKDGVCIVIATGKEHKFGSWQRKKIEGARNGCVVFEVPRVQKKTNGIVDTEMNGHEDAKEN